MRSPTLLASVASKTAPRFVNPLQGTTLMPTQDTLSAPKHCQQLVSSIVLIRIPEMAPRNIPLSRGHFGLAKHLIAKESVFCPHREKT